MREWIGVEFRDADVCAVPQLKHLHFFDRRDCPVVLLLAKLIDTVDTREISLQLEAPPTDQMTRMVNEGSIAARQGQPS